MLWHAAQSFAMPERDLGTSKPRDDQGPRSAAPRVSDCRLARANSIGVGGSTPTCPAPSPPSLMSAQIHAHQELFIRLGPPHAVDEQLHCLDRIHVVQDPPEDPHATQLLFVH